MAVIQLHWTAAYWWIFLTLFTVFPDGSNTFYTSLLTSVSFQDDAHSFISKSYSIPDPWVSFVFPFFYLCILTCYSKITDNCGNRFKASLRKRVVLAVCVLITSEEAQINAK